MKKATTPTKSQVKASFIRAALDYAFKQALPLTIGLVATSVIGVRDYLQGKFTSITLLAVACVAGILAGLLLYHLFRSRREWWVRWILSAVLVAAVAGCVFVLAPQPVLPSGVSRDRIRHPIATPRELDAAEIIGRTVFVHDLPYQQRTIATAGVDLSTQAIVGKRFIRCDIIGPAVLGLHNPKIVSTDLGGLGDIESILFEAKGELITGIVPMVDCSFEQCAFFEVGFAGPKALLDLIRRDARPRQP